jgi:hypothetical protein
MTRFVPLVIEEAVRNEMSFAKSRILRCSRAPIRAAT